MTIWFSRLVLLKLTHEIITLVYIISRYIVNGTLNPQLRKLRDLQRFWTDLKSIDYKLTWCRIKSIEYLPLFTWIPKVVV